MPYLSINTKVHSRLGFGIAMPGLIEVPGIIPVVYDIVVIFLTMRPSLTTVTVCSFIVHH